ncbi:autotransporter outer membrane beta-barrel domain-containing protein [Budvicia diplopodorum]|uniref:autotransporter outer membrane beta-barrel domain-containing protein n=1 Tax=Budvicia diplopodorum TaxID=1119056 RepID=UPI0013597AB1|nr:autotransporter outer membrane beta-barrel domain-containing protein [Budvicia diplopodorum]
MKYQGHNAKSNGALFPVFSKRILASLLFPLISTTTWAVDTTISVIDGSSSTISGDLNTSTDYTNLITVLNPGSMVNNSGGNIFTAPSSTTGVGGAVVANGGVLNLDGAEFNLDGKSSYLIQVRQAGSKINLNNVQASIGLAGVPSYVNTGIVASDGAAVSLNNSTITNHSGLYLLNVSGANTTLTGSNNTFNSSSSYALLVSDASATLNNTTINLGSSLTTYNTIRTMGNGSNLVMLNGLNVSGTVYYSSISNHGAVLKINDAILNQTNGRAGIDTWGGETTLTNVNFIAVLNSVLPTDTLIYVDDATLNIEGGSYEVSNGYGFVNGHISGELHANNTQITTNSDESKAIGSLGNTVLANTQITTRGNDSIGLYSSGVSGVIDGTHLNVTIEGANSLALSANHLGSMSISDSIISTLGTDAHGLNVQDGGSILLTDSQISTTGNGADGIYANNGNNQVASVRLDHSSLISATANAITASGTSLNVDATNGSQISSDNGILINAITDNSSGTAVTSTINLYADSGSILTGDIQAEQDNVANLSLANGAVWNGTTHDANNINVGKDGTWNLTGDADVVALNLGGNVNYAPGNSLRASGTDFSTLTVKNDLIGNGGVVIMNAVLGDDSSPTDKLVVLGNTSGDVGIQIKNAGGIGAQTVNGIQLVSVAGQSDGNFKLSSRAVAGTYEYKLSKNLVDGGWYLNSSAIRAEAGSYISNMAAANKLFNLRLEDRDGRAENSSMWLRQQGDRTKFRDATGQIKSSTNTYVIQGGGEVADTQFGITDRLGIGLMLGYGKSDSKSISTNMDYTSKGTVDGYSGGAYATWYQDAKTLDGLYVDSWVQYSLLNGEVNGDQLSGESYDMNGFSASVESGYRMSVYQSENGNVFVTPQAQITWNGVKADRHTESNGTLVESDGNNNIQTRLGVKLSRDGVSEMDKGSDKLFTTYVEANWIHNTEQAGTIMDGVSMEQAGNIDVAELKLGAEGQLNKNVNLWTNVAQQVGDDGYSDTVLTVGFKYKF